MEALRIVLHQTSANYRREESIDNKMTYPLPPLSTVIGALHAACAFTEYHEMDLSIQGKYESMHREPYTDYCFLNSVMDDRGILVKMRNESLLSSAFEKVATAKKSQGNSFRKRVTIQVHNEAIMTEYCDLKNLGDEIKAFKEQKIRPLLEQIKNRKKALMTKKKAFDKESMPYQKVCLREREIKELEKQLTQKIKQFEQENYLEPLTKFRSLTTSIKYYEILNNLKLIIHVKAEKKILNTILENIYNLKAIGRSEDFVDVIDARIVTLAMCEDVSDSMGKSNYSAYLNYDDIIKDNIFTVSKAGRVVNGTLYYMNKNYKVQQGVRKFIRKKVIYASGYQIDETSENVYLDYGENESYIVNFV